MKAEYWMVIGVGAFFLVVSPIYWVMSGDPTGTTALVITFLLFALIGFYLGVVQKQIDARPEDRSQGEIAEGAGEQGFFPPYSWWPFACALAIGAILVGFIIGWWMFIIACGFGFIAVCGWVFEYYRGLYAH